jgi:pyruvate, orthophosphate dikinase
MGQPTRAQAMTARFVSDISAVDAEDVSRYGGKATGLARMARAGIPIPPAFVIGTDAFHRFRADTGQIAPDVMAEVDLAMRRLEASCGKAFGGPERPLLVSVRSGAAISMPGMMDTVLNLGLDARSALWLAASTRSPAFALDTWIRFWRMYADSVLGLDPDDLAQAVAEPQRRAVEAATQDSFEAVESAVLGFIADNGETANNDPGHLLERTIAAIFRSWDSARAKAYRKHHAISEDLGTAVTIQTMVFGNADARSGSGVAFTRNPNDGTRALYGEYLIGRQGEDLVAGTHTPIDLSDPGAVEPALRDALIGYGQQLEALYRDAVDIEFTVESGTLYLLQVRPAKRTGSAAIRIAEDMREEGLLGATQALQRISVEQVQQTLKPVFDPAALAGARLIAQGLGSSPGQASGSAVLDSDRAADRAASGEDVILLRPTTSPQDIRGMLAANGIVTARGGALSHAAVVSRALDKPCIVGCETIGIDHATKTFTAGGRRFAEGDPISIDGATGKVFDGAISLKAAGAGHRSLHRLLACADELSGAEVWAAPRGEEELKSALIGDPAGIGVVGLTDLLISHGRIEPLIALIRAAGQAEPSHEATDAIGEIVYEACRPVIADADGLPVHIRLPRVSSNRARQMIEDWSELSPALFMPLGAPDYVPSILNGMAAAAKDTGHDRTTAVIGGIIEAGEFGHFVAEAAKAGTIGAGAMIQNVTALHAARELARNGERVWIDVVETVRTAHGLPSEATQSPATLDAYVQSGHIAANPLRNPPAFLAALYGEVLSAGGTEVGVDCTGGLSSDLLVGLYRLGFRRFAAPTVRRDEVRLLLGQNSVE